MSWLSTETICRVAASLQIDQRMGHETAHALATEVEVRLRRIIQDAQKFASHAHRSKLTPQDINHAVRLNGDNRLIGFAADRQTQFAAQFQPGTHLRKSGNQTRKLHRTHQQQQHEQSADIYFYKDVVTDLNTVANDARMVKRPRVPELLCHFLAIKGSQPAIPENPEQHPDIGILPFLAPVVVSAETIKKKNTRIENVVEHELSSEQIAYYKTVVKDVLSSSRSALRTVYESLSRGFGLQNLLPYFIRFLCDQQLHILKSEPRPLWSLTRLRALLRMIQCMLSNPSIEIEAYLHKLNPFMLTVIVNRLLTSSIAEDHWLLRDYASHLIAKICDVYSEKYPAMRTKIVKTLFEFLRQRHAPYTSQYGAIVGLAALGETVTEQALLPICRTLFVKIYTLLQQFCGPRIINGEPSKTVTANNPLQAVEAQRCAYALKVALQTLVRKLLREEAVGIMDNMMGSSSSKHAYRTANSPNALSASPCQRLLTSLTSDQGMPFIVVGNLLTASDCRMIGGPMLWRVAPPQQQILSRRRNDESVSKAETVIKYFTPKNRRIPITRSILKREANSALSSAAKWHKNISHKDSLSSENIKSSSTESTNDPPKSESYLLLEQISVPVASKVTSNKDNVAEITLRRWFQQCLILHLTALYPRDADNDKLLIARERGYQMFLRAFDNEVTRLIDLVRGTNKKCHTRTNDQSNDSAQVTLEHRKKLLTRLRQAIVHQCQETKGNNNLTRITQQAWQNGSVSSASSIETEVLQQIIAVTVNGAKIVQGVLASSFIALLSSSPSSNTMMLKPTQSKSSASKVNQVLHEVQKMVFDNARLAVKYVRAEKLQRKQQAQVNSVLSVSVHVSSSSRSLPNCAAATFSNFNFAYPSRYVDPEPGGKRWILRYATRMHRKLAQRQRFNQKRKIDMVVRN